MDIKITAKAESDLVSIWHYTYTKWGEDQAAAYLRKINETVLSLKDYPKKGKIRHEVTTNCRFLPVERHILIYREQDNIIVILRVLHGSVDFPAHVYVPSGVK
jgi:toxin ParE1/3/4